MYLSIFHTPLNPLPNLQHLPIPLLILRPLPLPHIRIQSNLTLPRPRPRRTPSPRHNRSFILYIIWPEHLSKLLTVATAAGAADGARLYGGARRSGRASRQTRTVRKSVFFCEVLVSW